jgi:hypothetical protein
VSATGPTSPSSPTGTPAGSGRRSPRYLRFLLTGAVAGLLVTVVVVLGRGDAVDRPVALFFYLGLLLVGAGALVGGLAAVLATGRAEPGGPDPRRLARAPEDSP